MSSGATTSAGRAKKDGGRCWEGLVAEEWLGGEIVHRIESISCLRYFDKESTAALRR